MAQESLLAAIVPEGPRGGPRVLAVDGPSVMHRAFHANPPLSAPDGSPTGALHGLLGVVLRALLDENATHAFVAFDLVGPTVRHAVEPTYKAHRPPTDPALRSQLNAAPELVRAAGIGVLSLPGYEADDLLAAVVRAFPGGEVVLLSSDRDLFQCIRDGVTILRPGGGSYERVDAASVRQTYGFGPERWIDYKALRGDPSDGLPGVRGIGEKGAAELVRAYGDLEGIYAALETVAPKLRAKLGPGREVAFATRELVRLRADCATVVPSAGALALADDAALRELLGRLGLRAGVTLWERWRARLAQRVA